MTNPRPASTASIGDLAAPSIGDFPATPTSWHFVSESGLLEKAPVEIELAGERVAVFRDGQGQARAIDGFCPHLGARLAEGRVIGGRLQCPYHGWSFDGEGRCAERSRRARCYATAEAHGAVFVFPAAKPHFDLPRFGELDEAGLCLGSARPFHYELAAPWFMVAAQAFDLRHFLGIHGRVLEGPPRVEALSPVSRRMTSDFRITGDTWMDRATRWVSGARVEFQMTVFGGNIVLVRTRFAKDRTYGFVIATPFGPGRVRITIIVSAAKAHSGIARALLDPLRLRMKRLAVRSMTRHDLHLLDGMRYHSPELCEGDEELAGYLNWVSGLPRGELTEPTPLRRSTAS